MSELTEARLREKLVKSEAEVLRLTRQVVAMRSVMEIALEEEAAWAEHVRQQTRLRYAVQQLRNAGTR